MTENLSAIGYKIRQPELRLKPIRLLSATFATTKPIVTYGNGTSTQSHHTPSHQDARSIDLPSGDIVFDTTPLVSLVLLDRDGLLLTPADEEQTSKVFVSSWL